MVNVEVALEANAELGEGPVWDANRQQLLFVDIMRGDVHAFDPVKRMDAIFEVGQPAGAVAATTRGDWMVAARDGFYRLDPATGRTQLSRRTSRTTA
jgi:sugar lactone lactonase YvrE